MNREVLFFQYHRDGFYTDSGERIPGLNDYERIFLKIIFDSDIPDGDVQNFVERCINDPILSESSVRKILYLYKSDEIVKKSANNPNVSTEFIREKCTGPDAYMMTNSNSEELVMENNKFMRYAILSNYKLHTRFSEKCYRKMIVTKRPDYIVFHFPYWNSNISHRFYEEHGDKLGGIFWGDIRADEYILEKYISIFDKNIFRNRFISDEILLKWLGERDLLTTVRFICPMRNILFEKYFKTIENTDSRLERYDKFQIFTEISSSNWEFMLKDLDYLVDIKLKRDPNNGLLIDLLDNILPVLSQKMTDIQFISYMLKIIIRMNFLIIQYIYKPWFYENMIIKDRVNREILLFFNVKERYKLEHTSDTLLLYEQEESQYKCKTRLRDLTIDLHFLAISPRFALKKENTRLFLKAYMDRENFYTDWCVYNFNLLKRINMTELKSKVQLLQNKRDFAPHCSGYYSAKRDYEKICERISEKK